MVVNSIKFWIFFIIVLIAYYGLFRKSSRWQNITLLISSYIFYGMVDWKMCALLLVATAVFYSLGVAISKNNGNNEKVASRLTTLGVLLGIGMLFYFKYLDFFVGQFGELLSAIGIQNDISTFGILMPLGISFFTFKLISYVVEVHRETIEPCMDPIAFATFVAFFPTIMSGPIDRPKEFLNQLYTNRTPEYDNFAEGARRIVWGMFLKMCIADRVIGYTSAVFGNYESHNATSIVIAMFFYAFEMYTDFAGYTEMAIGVSQILGIKIRENFKRPFFAQNVNEYWRKWHMSLTTWITDYVYMPLNISFRNLGQWGLYLATLINVVAIGAWHGANWTYILFGLYHGIILVIIAMVEKKRKKFEKKNHLVGKWYYKYPRIILTFVLVSVGMVLFRSVTISDFFNTIARLGSGFGMPYFDLTVCAYGLFFISVLFLKELKDENGWNIHLLHSEKSWVRVVTFSVLVLTIILMGELDGGSFIYFQF